MTATRSSTLVVNMDANTVFPRTQIVKGDNEKTIAELRQTAAENAARKRTVLQPAVHDSAESFPCAACFVLALIGLALGASNSKEGKLASFTLGTGVVFV